MAVNCYVEPVYTLDADLVVVVENLARLAAHLQGEGFRIDRHAHSLNSQAPDSKLRIQFTIDERWQAFVPRSVEAEVLGLRVRVANLEDVTQRKLWTYGDANRRFSKRKKDELD